MLRSVPKPIRNVDHDFRTWIRARPCLLADREPSTCGPYLDIVTKKIATRFCHVRSRGAGGGDPANAWPGCDAHHVESHRLGRKAFERKYGLNLRLIANELWARYCATVGQAPW